jgi:mannose-6-phosphate isomerase-like protein (cupin superfamily)
MKKMLLFCLFAIPLGAVVPDEAVPAGFEHWTPAFFAQLAQTLGPKSAADAHHVASQKLCDYPNDWIAEVHRVGDGSPELHETQVDVFFVQSGSGVLIVGGTLTGADTIAPNELRNGTIQGGVRRKLTTGDVVRIPARIPHQVLLDGAKEITYAVVKVKNY